MRCGSNSEFDLEKAIEVILYFSNKVEGIDMYSILKMLYFADKEHLNKYGRFICGDSYCAMEHGPVPVNVYDIFKELKNKRLLRALDEKLFNLLDCIDYYPNQNHKVVPKRNYDIDYFSESDIECLDKIIQENRYCGFSELKRKSHDSAYNSVQLTEDIKSAPMPKELIASILPRGKELIEYLSEQ